MIAHVVLFRPRSDLEEGARRALADAFSAATRQIPSIRRCRVGRRLRLGHAYELTMREDYSHAVVLEFDDVAGLNAYLEHPAHAVVAELFFRSADQALMYDFELGEGEAALSALVTNGA